MTRIFPVALLILLLAAPQSLRGQDLAVGARAGTLGLGGEVALGLSDALAVRGGFGIFPLDYTDEFEGYEYTVTFPTSIWSVGLDLYIGGGPVRLMGGVMGRSGDLEVESDISGTRVIGDQEYQGSGTLKGALVQNAVAPFAGIGFGKHTAGSFGFFVDLAVAFTGEPDVNLSVTGPIAAEPGIQQAVENEADAIKDDAGSYIEYWPVLSIGFKLPLSGGF